MGERDGGCWIVIVWECEEMGCGCGIGRIDSLSLVIGGVGSAVRVRTEYGMKQGIKMIVVTDVLCRRQTIILLRSFPHESSIASCDFSDIQADVEEKNCRQYQLPWIPHVG